MYHLYVDGQLGLPFETLLEAQTAADDFAKDGFSCMIVAEEHKQERGSGVNMNIRDILLKTGELLNRYEDAMSSLEAQFDTLKEYGRVVAISGFFNPLHYGHLE